MLQLKRTQKTNNVQEVEHQDHFCCTIRCRFCDKRRHYEDECHITAANPKNIRKRKRNGVRPPVRVEEPKGGALSLEVLRVRVTLLEDEGPQPPTLVEEEHPTPHLRVRRLLKNGQPSPPQALVAPTRAARKPRSAA